MDLVKREVKQVIDPDWMRKYAKSGDVLCRFIGTGLSSLVMWGTGGPCSHMLMFMWGRGDEEGKLMVIQSNGKGIWRQTVDDFWLENDGSAISMFPLSPEARAKWDFNKAWDFFESVEGSPYGYAIFLFGFLDTPEDNFPQITDSNSWATFITMLNDLPHVGPEAINLVWTRAMAKRLGMPEGQNWPDVVEEATKKGLTIGEVLAIPEKEEWLYDGKHQYNCCGLVMAVLYHGGMFGDDKKIKLVPQEFTPKDVLQLNIYDKDYKLPPECEANDPDLPYCQLDGLYKMQTKGYNSLEVYEHMNEHCPSKAPTYVRPDGC